MSPSSNKGHPHDLNEEKAPQKLIQEILESTKKEAYSRTYQESLNELELILVALQDESIPVEEIHINYLKGKIYLRRCEDLLKSTEQTVLEINLEAPESNNC